MKKRSKRYLKALELVEKNKSYTLSEALDTLKKFPNAKFDETLELAMYLGVDPKQADQMVRGTVSLPSGTGKSVRILVLTKGENVKAAQDAGADYVGLEDLIKKIEGGWFEFDAVVASPDAMRETGQLGKVLGPRGLMPSPKAGTVTPNVVSAIKELKRGRIEFKTDKAGNVHVPLGKFSFDKKAIEANVLAVYDAIARAKPSSVKGTYIHNCSISTTMGPALRLDLKALMSITTAA